MTSPDAFRETWRAASITREAFHDPAADALLAELRRVYANGGAELACFRIPETCLFVPTAANLEHVADYFADFLLTPAAQAALQPLHISEPLLRSPELYGASAFTLDGELARVLVLGGAYRRFEGTPQEAKALGAGFCNALFGDRFTEVDLFYSPTPWSSWFADIAWDATWFGLDRSLSRLWMLCTTDTD